MIQELCAKGGEYMDSPSPPERPRQHQLPQLGNVPVTGDYISSNSNNQAAAINHMIPHPEEFLAYKELEHVPLGSCNPDAGEPGGCVSSNMLQKNFLCRSVNLTEYTVLPQSEPDVEPYIIGKIRMLDFCRITVRDSDMCGESSGRFSTNSSGECVLRVLQNNPFEVQSLEFNLCQIHLGSVYKDARLFSKV
ncbi:hypothetical protein ACE6H2_022829 [Prunus campanulata]